MKKVLFGFLLALVFCFLILNTFTAPTNNELNKKCSENSLPPGADISWGNTEFTCPKPTSTPTVIYKYLIETSLSICDTPENFGNVTNDKWLALNVFGSVSEWRYESGNWVYTFVPYDEEIIGGAGIRHEYMDGFRYPGFGVYKLYLYEGGTQIISNYGDGYYWVHFTKLELSCE